MNLYLREGARIIGLGGKGGDAGLSKVSWDATKETDGIQFDFNSTGMGQSSDGGQGGTAIQVENDISEFKIYLPSSFSIYGGGGGGGGGDTVFAARAAALVRQSRKDKNVSDDRQAYLQEVNGSIVINLTANPISESIGEFDIKELIGVHRAGFGGGGQGYPYSSPGKTYIQDSDGVYDEDGTYNKNKGDIKGPGAGRALDINQLVSQGGDGGAFGQFGLDAPSSTFSDGTFRIDPYGGSLNGEPNGKKGGAGGFAIYSNSTTYTTSNIFGTLLFTYFPFQPSSISGFIARWDASTTVYNTGTTDAADGQTVESWIAAEKNPLITDTVKIAGGNSKPKFYTDSTRTQYFNSKPSIEFYNDNSATIENIVGTGGYKLDNDIDSFDIFYVVFPNSFVGGDDQFKNGYKTNNSPFEFSKFGGSSGLHQTLYSTNGEMKERTGMPPDDAYDIATEVRVKQNRPMPSYAFVYNVTAQRNGAGFTYRSYINNILKKEHTVSDMSNLSFEGNNPILGKHYRHRTSFNISDIVVYRRQLLEKERGSVYLYLTQRARRPLKTINANTTIDRNTLNNKIEDETGFAGYARLNT
jgi:hypothetical protein